MGVADQESGCALAGPILRGISMNRLRRAADLLRLPCRALGSLAHGQPRRNHVRDHAARTVRTNGSLSSTTVRPTVFKLVIAALNWATAQRHKSVPQGDCRCRIQRRHRSHPRAGDPRRLTTSSPKILHSSPQRRPIPFGLSIGQTACRSASFFPSTVEITGLRAGLVALYAQRVHQP